MKALDEDNIRESNRDRHFITRIIIMAVSAAVFALAFVGFILNVEYETLNYHENGNVTYDVCLRPNDYYIDECQPSGKQYIASLIRTIDAEFHYSFSLAEEIEREYSYDITAKLVATESGADEKILYEKEEILLSEKSVAAVAGKIVKIDEPIQINYQKYNSLMTSFRTDYGLTLKANLYVTMNVRVSGTHENFATPIKSDQKITLRIPMSERTINVALETDGVNSDSFIEEEKRDPTKSLLFVAVAGASAVVFVFTLVMSIVVSVRRKSDRSDYEKELDKITKEYNQLIVEVEHVPKIDQKNVIEVKSFDELLDVRDTIQKPILHLQISDQRSLFIIEGDNGGAYVYAMGMAARRRYVRRKERKNEPTTK